VNDVVTGAQESFIQSANADFGNGTMAEYKHGSMDISSQRKTFEGFVKTVTWSVGVILAVLVFMAIFAR
jgi:hypothetical protein